MQNIPQRPQLQTGLLITGALLIGGLVTWLLWQWPSGMFYLLYGGLTLTLAAGVARLWAGVLVHLRRNTRARLDAQDAERITLANRSQGLPPSITSLNYHDSHRALPAPAPPIIDVAPIGAPPSVPTFAQLLDGGQIGPGRQLILGYAADSGQPIGGSWNDLYSAGVGGMTGSGKSWAIAFLAGQSAAAGARIILIDPHQGDSESLSGRLEGLGPSYMCDVASSGRDIENALKLASSKLENRRAGRGGNWPLLLIVDEWTSLLRGKLGDLLTATALDYAEQGRKYGCFALLGAQAWQIDAAGTVRDRLASHYVLRTRGDQFRYQTGLRAASAPEDTLTLQPGQAYFLTTRGALSKVVIPEMTQRDIARLGALVDKPAAAIGAPFGFTPAAAPLQPVVASWKPDGSQMVAKPNQATTASGPTKTASPEAARAAGLFLAGKEPAEIVAELRGVRSNQGRAYQTALAEITALIREGLR